MSMFLLCLVPGAVSCIVVGLYHIFKKSLTTILIKAIAITMFFLATIEYLVAIFKIAKYGIANVLMDKIPSSVWIESFIIMGASTVFIFIGTILIRLVKKLEIKKSNNET